MKMSSEQSMGEKLETEDISIQEFLKGNSISRIFRPHECDVCIECKDGTRFFVNAPRGSVLEFSITGGVSE
jgi:hypothetical protein